MDFQRKKFFHNILDSRCNSIKQIWKSINSICSYKKSKSGTRISKLTTEQGSITSSCDTANAFNNYFSSIGNTLASKLNHIPNAYKDYLLFPNVQSIFIDHVTENEVFTTIMSLNKSNSTGSDELTSRALQLSANTIIPVLTFIINKSFVLGIFPNSFKTAKVTPIYRKVTLTRLKIIC